MNYFIHFIILLTAIWLVGRKQPDSYIYYVGLVLKLGAGIALGLIFKHHYWGGDTFGFYESAKTLSSGTFQEWWQAMLQPEIGTYLNQPRAILFTKIVSGFIFFTKGDYWVVSCYLSFLSFLAFWFFYRQIKTTLPNIQWPVIIGFLAFPSTVFWSAGIMKGTLTNAALIYICAFTVKLFYRKKIHIPEIFLTTLSLILLYYIKYYLLILIVPVVLYALFDRKAHRAGIKRTPRVIAYSTIIVVTLVLAPMVNPNLNLLRLPENIHTNQVEAFRPTSDDSSIDLRIPPTWKDLLISLPHSLIVGLYGPSIFDSGSDWSWVPRLENLLLVLLTLASLAILYQRQLYTPDILVIATLLFIISLAFILPLAAPNFGALVRYKASFTPFFVTLVSILPCWYYQKRWSNQ